MIIDEKTTAIRISVLGFFLVSVIGCICKVTCLEITKRALIAAFFVYIGTLLTVKAINYILITSMLSQRQQESNNQNKEENAE